MYVPEDAVWRQRREQHEGRAHGGSTLARQQRQCMRQEGSAEARYVHLYLFLYAGATNTSQPEEVAAIESMYRLG